MGGGGDGEKEREPGVGGREGGAGVESVDYDCNVEVQRLPNKVHLSIVWATWRVLGVIRLPHMKCFFCCFFK